MNNKYLREKICFVCEQPYTKEVNSFCTIYYCLGHSELRLIDQFSKLTND